MKNCLFSIFVVIAIVPSLTQAVPYKEVVQHVAKQLKVSEQIATKFVQYVAYFVAEIEDNFEKIASDKTPRGVKNSLITETIENFFEDPMDSVVHVVSSKNNKTYPVSVYLRRLSQINNSATPKIDFDHSYLLMARIGRYIDPYTGQIGYEFDLYRRDKRNCGECTQNGPHFIFKQSKKDWVMKVHSITTDQKVSLDSPKWDNWK